MTIARAMKDAGGDPPRPPSRYLNERPPQRS